VSIRIVDIPLKQLKPNPDNPRTDVGDVSELAASIRAQGLKQELLVTPAGTDGNGAPLYRIVIGHRRFAAARLAGLEYLPCRVEEMTAREEREVMLVENTQRADLTPVEEADGYQGLLDLGADVSELAGKTGRSESFVRGRLKIASIPKELRGKSERFAQLSLADLDAIAGFSDDPKAQERLLGKAGTNDFGWTLHLLNSEREEKLYDEAAYAYCREHDIEVVELGGRSAWTMRPDGYRFPEAISRSTPFPATYETLAKDHEGKAWLAHGDSGWRASFPMTPEEIENDRRRDEEREARAAQLRERRELISRFAGDSMELRSVWMRKRLTGLKAIALRAGVVRLAFQALIGAHGLTMSEWNPTGVHDTFDAYNMLAPTPLPDKPEGAGDAFWTDEIKRRGMAAGAGFRELLLLLAAHLEARIAWDEQEGVAVANTYYDVLESLGYPVSGAERKALDGGFLPEKQDE
jgi:ParB family chromosome partitioning protein